MVPNFIDRSIWGISHTSDFSYISGGAPAITHTHTRGTMEITAGAIAWSKPKAVSSGAFVASTGTGWGVAGGNEHKPVQAISFKASNSWSGSTSNNTAVDSVFGSYTNGIRPNACSIKVKTRFH